MEDKTRSLAMRIKYEPALSYPPILYGSPVTDISHAKWRQSAKELLSSPHAVRAMLLHHEWQVRMVGLAIAWLQHHEHHYDAELRWLLQKTAHFAELTASCWSLMLTNDQLAQMDALLDDVCEASEIDWSNISQRGLLATYSVLELLNRSAAAKFRDSACYALINTPINLQYIRQTQLLRQRLVLPPPLN